MTQLLGKALSEVSKSQDPLARLADEALPEHHSGKTKPL
jgi:hypothetical protein